MDHIRRAFENWMSDNGKWPKAVEKNSKGEYILMQANYGWIVWQAACEFMEEAK